MSRCPHCGGIINRDCFNPIECGQITQNMNYYQAPHDGYSQGFNDGYEKAVQELEQRNRELVDGIQKAIDELNTVDGRSLWDIEYDLKQLISKHSAPAGQKGGENGT